MLLARMYRTLEFEELPFPHNGSENSRNVGLNPDKQISVSSITLKIGKIDLSTRVNNKTHVHSRKLLNVA